MGKVPFSQRMGIVRPKLAQHESLDLETRTRLFNVAVNHFIEPQLHRRLHSAGWGIEIQTIWDGVLKRPLPDLHDLLPPRKLIAEFRGLFYNLEWHLLLDLVEAMVNSDSDAYEAIDDFNSVLESENSAYRFVGTEITEITDPVEIAEVETATEGTSSSADHMRAAVTAYAQRPIPDLRNAIKEAISAVEAEARITSGKEKMTLGDALKYIPDLPAALKNGASSLYGYASAAGGIRHAKGEEERHPTRDEARFMLVVCSALVNLFKAQRESNG